VLLLYNKTLFDIPQNTLEIRRLLKWNPRDTPFVNWWVVDRLARRDEATVMGIPDRVQTSNRKPSRLENNRLLANNTSPFDTPLDMFVHH
jgi:hypothetical protein